MQDFLLIHEVKFVTALVGFFLIVGSYIVFKLDSTREKKFELSIRIIAAVSVVLLIYDVVEGNQSNIRIEKNRTSFNTLTNIQRNWLSPQIELYKAYPESYFLYRSMTPDADYDKLQPLEYDSVKRNQVEVVYAFRIFQAIEDYLTIGAQDLTGQYVWVNNYLMWMQSSLLRERWAEIGFNFSLDTRELIGRLIVESDKLIALRKEKGKLDFTDYDQISADFKIKHR